MPPVEELAALAAFAGEGFLGSGAGRLKALAGELGAPDLEEALSGDPVDLEREYVRLFLSPEGAVCPLWQSANADPPQLMGASHHSALAWYRSEGIEPSRTGEPADHAGLLLAFYAKLLDAGAGTERLEAFRLQHLAWLAPVCDTLLERARHPFYRLLAELTRDLIGG